MERRMVATVRECPARLVPDGTRITIPSGVFVTITQSLWRALMVPTPKHLV